MGTPGLAEKVALANSLKGEHVRFHSDPKTTHGYFVRHVTADRMVALDGWMGLFSPHLFEVVNRPVTKIDGSC